MEPGGAGALPPTPPPSPPTAHMMFWAHGYGGGIEATAGVVSKVKDFSGQAQDLDTTEAGKEPLTGVYTIDGNPTWSMGDGSTEAYIRRFGTMKNSEGNPVAPADVRTFWAVLLPQTSSTGIGFDITGGACFCWQEGPYFTPVFDLESFFHPDGFYLFDNAWRFDGGVIQGPDTPAATYDNVPTIVCWIGAATNGSPVKVYVNGSLVATTPANAVGVTGPSTAGFMSGNSLNLGGGINLVPFQGGIAEQIAYDYDQSTDPDNFAATLAYLRAFYPSVP